MPTSDEMKAAIAETPLDQDGQAGAGPPTPPAPDAQPEAPGEAGEGTDEDGVPATEDAENAKPADPAEEEKKSSSYQRLQRRHEIAREDAKRARGEAAEALVIANEWRARALLMHREFQKVLHEAGRSGYRRDPRDDRLLQAEMERSGRSIQDSAKTHIDSVQESAEVRELSNQYVEEAETLASKYKGISKGEILRAYAAVVESAQENEEIPMEEIANLLYSRKVRNRNPAEQARKNGTAIRPIRPGSTQRPPEFKADHDGMKNYLKSVGLA